MQYHKLPEPVYPQRNPADEPTAMPEFLQGEGRDWCRFAIEQKRTEAQILEQQKESEQKLRELFANPGRCTALSIREFLDKHGIMLLSSAGQRRSPDPVFALLQRTSLGITGIMPETNNFGHLHPQQFLPSHAVKRLQTILASRAKGANPLDPLHLTQGQCRVLVAMCTLETNAAVPWQDIQRETGVGSLSFNRMYTPINRAIALSPFSIESSKCKAADVTYTLLEAKRHAPEKVRQKRA